MTKKQKRGIKPASSTTKGVPPAHDILIAGGGIAGLTLAVLLAQAGADVGIIDPGTLKPRKGAHEPSGRTVALMQTSLSILAATGVWPALAKHSAPLRAMRMMDVSMARAQPQESVFYADELGLPQFGYNIPNHLLHNALLERAQKLRGLHLYAGARVTDYESGDSHVQAKALRGKDEVFQVRARLLVGAEGRNSTIRENAGIHLRRRDYDQAAITCLISHDRPHDNIATEFHRPPGPLALVPLPGQCSSVVWVEKRSTAEEVLRLRKQDFEARLDALTRGHLGNVHLQSKVESWPLCCLVADGLTAPRVALIAETIHVMSPITAQGLNLSLRDVAALAETAMDAMRLGLDPGGAGALKEYANRRSFDVHSRMAGVDGFNRFVAQEANLINGARRGALRVVSRITPLRRFAMRQGLAPMLDSGRLMRGGVL